ncbi:FtsK/SpoIIIE domain-containing protein [Actinokineospora sp. NPDC004072]
MGEASRRRMGAEFRVARWVVQHPGSLLVPGVPGVAVGALGEEAALAAGSWTLGAAVLGCGAWYRAHPDTFDRYALPVLRAWRRRWVTYMGWRWRNALLDCGLTTTNRRSGEERVPRILAVRCWSPTIDVVRVKLAPGQSAATWQDKLPELADCLKAERVGVEKVKPRVISLVIQRSEPFTEVIPAPEMPQDVRSVDLGSVYIGETEFATEFRIGVDREHVFVAGATGAGKNSVILAALRALAPMIRAGLVRLWLADPKQSEFAALAPIAYRYSTVTEPDDEDDDPYTIADLVREFRADMAATQRRLKADKSRKISVSRETPLNLLILDEIGAITAYSDLARLLRRDLAVIATQGRATGHRMWGLVQEPSKDVVPIRDLFTCRVCLRVTSAAHVDMVLGEDARARGALADEIPNLPETAGIGFVIRPRTRAPQRIRAAFTDDHEIAELVAFVLAGNNNSHLKVVA